MLAMVESGSQLHRDLCAMVVACTLAASVCSLLLSDSSSSTGIMKVHLHQLHEWSFEWPSEEDVLHERLSPLPKNIAKNFIETFYKEKEVALMGCEGLQLKEQFFTPPFIRFRVSNFVF